MRFFECEEVAVAVVFDIAVVLIGRAAILPFSERVESIAKSISAILVARSCKVSWLMVLSVG